MRPGVDLTKLDDGDVRVDPGGVEPGVAEQLLDEADVGPVFEHVGRKSGAAGGRNPACRCPLAARLTR